MEQKSGRRDFVKKSALSLIGTAAASAGVSAQTAPAAPGQPVPINPDAKAIMPSGKVMDRKQILKTLGLNPNIGPEAWLAVVACGSNASAIDSKNLDNLLKSGKVKEGDLDVQSIKNLQDLNKSKATKK